MSPSVAVLMYHRVGRPVFPEEGDYAVPAELFESHLAGLAVAGRPVVDLSAVAEGTFPEGSAALTFDDGYHSDVTAAAPCLRARGWTAAFFVSAAFVGRPGFAGWPELRGLADEGFVVGSHGLDHTLLDALPAGELRRQLGESKAKIEDGVGRAVTAFALPGGSGGERAHEAAREAGYALVLGSRPGRVRGRPGRVVLPRLAVRRAHAAGDVLAMVEGRPLRLFALGLRYAAARRARGLLGAPAYGRLRQAFVDLSRRPPG